MINRKIILLILGILLLLESFFLFLSGVVSIIYNGDDVPSFFSAAAVTFIFGTLGYYYNRDANKNFGKREGLLIVSLVWVVFSVFGCLPFILSGYIPSFTDAYFETISGFTTTGASILNDIEALPKGLLFWRSITQWLGGMGIIVLSLSILPFLGIGGMQLFSAEVPGVTPDKLHPRVKETAKRLWGIYTIFTLIEVVLLYVGGMTLFDAINHSFTTMATGGYSTKQASVAAFSSPMIQYVITLFMIIAGTNFTLSYFAMTGKFRKIWANEEFRYYLFFILFFTVLVTLGIVVSGYDSNLESAFRNAVFQVVSIMTTTGFATDNYLNWAPFLTFVIFVLMFFGGSAGSTGGGIKTVRLVVVIKNSYYELKRLMHPKAVLPVRLNKRAVSEKMVMNVLAFIVLYFVIFVVGVGIMSMFGLDLDTAMGSVSATLGNIGPGIGKVGPADNFAFIPDLGKWFLSFLMLLGRLELFTVLAILTPVFWKR